MKKHFVRICAILLYMTSLLFNKQKMKKIHIFFRIILFVSLAIEEADMV